MHYPTYALRSVIDLSGSWDFVFLGAVDPRRIFPETLAFTDRTLVPSAFDALPAYAGRRGAACYRTWITVPAGRRAFLEFDGVGLWGAVFIDGHKAGEHSGGYTRFRVDVPKAARERRELLVVADNQFDDDRAPLQREYFDWYNYGGITRPVRLHVVPETFIESVQVRTLNWQTGAVQVQVRLSGPETPPQPVACSIDGAPAQKRSIAGREAVFELCVPNPAPWTPAAPALHTLEIATGQDSMTVRFGLRQIEARAGKLWLNGAPLKLLGFNRHEAHPELGPALPEALMLADLQILRGMGCNFVRGSHYPQDQRFLDWCDELGFLVWEEACAWGTRDEDFRNERFLTVQKQGAAEMVHASFNHPSVILWGFFNEGHTDSPAARPAYTQMLRTIKSLDPTRPVTFAEMMPDKSTVLDLADVLSSNLYPGWYTGTLEDVVPKIREVKDLMRGKGGADKPFIVSEIGAAALYGCRDAHPVRWTENYQAELLRLAASECVGNDEITGLAIWQYCDCRTSDRFLQTALWRPRGFNNKGVLDEYRRPKQAVGTITEIFRGRKEQTAKNAETPRNRTEN